MRFAAAFFALLTISAVSAGYCSECQYLVGAVESWLESNSTVAYIEAQLDKVCTQVPGFTVFCEEFVAYGVPYIIQAIENSESPEHACQQLRFCSAKKPVIVNAMKIKGNALECEGCEYLIAAVESWAESKIDVKTIEKRLDSLCALVPGFAAPCTALVNTEVPQLLALIKRSENSTVVCTQLGVCSSSKAFSVMNKLKSVECNACLAIFTEVIKRLKSGSTVTDVEKAIINGFCNKAPQAYQATCDFIAQEGFSYVNSQLATITPQKVCSGIRVCSATLLN